MPPIPPTPLTQWTHHIYLGDDHLRIQARETFPAYPQLALLYLSQLLHYLADSRDEATPPPTHLPHQDPPHQPNRTQNPPNPPTHPPTHTTHQPSTQATVSDTTSTTSSHTSSSLRWVRLPLLRGKPMRLSRHPSCPPPSPQHSPNTPTSPLSPEGAYTAKRAHITYKKPSMVSSFTPSTI